jgi:hypothetical protein
MMKLSKAAIFDDGSEIEIALGSCKILGGDNL